MRAPTQLICWSSSIDPDPTDFMKALSAWVQAKEAEGIVVERKEGEEVLVHRGPSISSMKGASPEQLRRLVEVIIQRIPVWHGLKLAPAHLFSWNDVIILPLFDPPPRRAKAKGGPAPDVKQTRTASPGQPAPQPLRPPVMRAAARVICWTRGVPDQKAFVEAVRAWLSDMRRKGYDIPLDPAASTKFEIEANPMLLGAPDEAFREAVELLVQDGFPGTRIEAPDQVYFRGEVAILVLFDTEGAPAPSPQSRSTPAPARTGSSPSQLRAAWADTFTRARQAVRLRSFRTALALTAVAAVIVGPASALLGSPFGEWLSNGVAGTLSATCCLIVFGLALGATDGMRAGAPHRLSVGAWVGATLGALLGIVFGVVCAVGIGLATGFENIDMGERVVGLMAGVLGGLPLAVFYGLALHK